MAESEPNPGSRPESSLSERLALGQDEHPLLGCFEADASNPPGWAQESAAGLEGLPNLLPCRLFREKPSLSPLLYVSQAELARRKEAPERRGKPAAEGRAGRKRKSERSPSSKRSSRDSAGLPLQPGAVLEKYKIEEVIGRGAFAVVYRATHLLLRNQVAIKMLLPKVFAHNPKHAAMLRDEARLAARVDHPNVVRVWDIHQADSLTYIVMELVDGTSLAKRISKQKRLSPSEIARIALDVASGLEAALDRGVLHRDIKPSNILVTASGTAKVIDLGLACHASPDAAGTDFHKLLFPAHAVVGTPTYMSPEQLESPRKIDYRSDIYSLGVTLYHAAVGAPPFIARSVAELEDLLRRTIIAPAAEVVPGFPPTLSDWIERMMSRERKDRPASYAEIKTALRSLLGTLEPG